MFDIAPSELLIVAIVALLVIGPKDLPKVMVTLGRWAGKARAMSRHFRSGVDAMMREAEMEELNKQWAKHNAEIMAQFPREEILRPHDQDNPMRGSVALSDVPSSADAAPQMPDAAPQSTLAKSTRTPKATRRATRKATRMGTQKSTPGDVGPSA